MAFPSTAVLDDFNRSEDPLSQSGAWSGPIESGLTQLLTNGTGAKCVTGGAAGSYRNADVGPNCEVYCTISTKDAANDSVYLYTRTQSPGLAGIDAYVLEAKAQSAGTDQLTLFRVDDGAGTQLGATISQEFANGDKYGLEAIGADLNIYYYTGGSWSLLGSRSDGTYSAAGKLGMTIVNDSWEMDDFGGGSSGSIALTNIDISQFPKPYPWQLLQ